MRTGQALAALRGCHTKEGITLTDSSKVFDRLAATFASADRGGRIMLVYYYGHVNGTLEQVSNGDQRSGGRRVGLGEIGLPEG